MVIFCGSRASAQQTLEHIVPFIERKLFLKVNREKTVVAYAGKIKFLGYGFYKNKDGFRLRTHEKSKAKMKAKVRLLTSRGNVNSYEERKGSLKRLITGWVNYYRLADMGNYLQSIDKWMRRRIRMAFWKKWKRVRTRWRNLLKLGVSNSDAGILACSRKGYWRIADSPTMKTALSNQRLEKAGFRFFSSYYRKSVAT